MIASEIINTMIPPLKVTDDAHKALVWMEELRCTHLPVVENGQLMGFLSEEIIIEINDVEKKIIDFELVGKTCFTYMEYHFYDILKVAGRHNSRIVAVLNEQQEYQGVVTVQDIVASVSQTMAVQTQGGILTLSLSILDYSLAEIGRLVEENNAKILSSIVMEDDMDEKKLKLNLKINQLDLTHIVATLERFGYKIIGKYQENQEQFESNHERIDMLMRYLNT